MTGNYLLLFTVLWPFIGAIIGYLIGRKNKNARDWFVIAVTVIEFLAIVALYPVASNATPAMFRWDGFSGFTLFLKLDGFRFIYALIASFMWMMTTIFSREYFSHHYKNRNRYFLFTIMTLGATIAILTSADLMTTFIFFEIMTFTSYVMAVHDETEKAKHAGAGFLIVGVLGGLVMLIGLFMMKHYLGTTEMELLLPALQAYTGSMTPIYVLSGLMMVGFGGKAGMFPLHFWLPQAHPVAPAPASALLSGILTKAGIFGALVLSTNLLLHDAAWGTAILILGAITMFLGAFLALFSIDLKRTLALSSVSQIGFILVGLGMQNILGEHNALAVRGTLLHMVNHSLIKLVLFMAAGTIYMKLHKLDLNTLRGYGRGKPVLMFIFVMGSLSLMGVPLWSGYISKTLIHESIVEQIWMMTSYTSMATLLRVVESFFTLSGGFTIAYMTKLFVAIFVEKNPYHQDEHDKFNGNYMSGLSIFALIVPAVMVFVLGAFPQLMNGIADFGQAFMHGHAPAHAVEYFAWINLKGAIASASIGLITYFLVIRNLMMAKDENGNMMYINVWPAFMDLEKVVYEPLLMTGLPFISAFVFRVISVFPTWVGTQVYTFYKFVQRQFYKPLNVATPQSVSDDMLGEDLEAPGVDKVVSSSISFTLLSFGFSVVVVSLIVIVAQAL